MGEVEVSTKSDKMLSRNASLAKKLYYILLNDPKNRQKNLLFSPLSLHTALAMLSEGALGTTKDALVQVLEIVDSNAEEFKLLMESLQSSEDVKLAIANKIYSVTSGGRDIILKERFVEILKSCYKSEFDSVDCDKPKVAANIVNGWVNGKIEGLIPQLLETVDQPGLLLINVIYFKSDWLHKFDPRPQRKFYLDNEKTIDVDMMYSKKCYNYKRDEEIEAEIVEIPYKNTNHKMIVIVPFKKDGINNLEEKLQAYDMKKIFNSMENTYMELYLPKFKVEETLPLNNPLKEMGLSVMFDKWKANLGAMVPINPTENYYVAEVLQKCVFEVNEEGCEAAAATVVRVGVAYRSAVVEMPPRTVVDVDHPAIFMLVSSYQEESVVLFYGKLFNPK